MNWPREGGDEAVSNPLWDTHAQNADRLQDVLCPIFDVGFTALIDDLGQRGLLSETLVVAIGEFGRTPKINRQGGRDHWGHVFSFALAGAGISGGQVYGSSDKQGAYPRDGRMEPQDLTATILHLLGIGHHAMFPDATGRPYHATTGEPIAALLGDRPATSERVRPEGNLALVPGYSKDQLLNPRFADDVPLSASGAGTRLKGWQARPLSALANEFDFGVRLVASSNRRFAALGYGIAGPCTAGSIPAGASALLVQEIRNPRAGTYTIDVDIRGGGVRADFALFLEQFRCRAVLFGYRNLDKDPTKGWREFAAVPIEPLFGDTIQTVKLTRKLRSQDDGASEIEMGVGLAIVAERKTAGPLDVSAGRRAFLCVDAVQFEFVPRARNDNVTE